MKFNMTAMKPFSFEEYGLIMDKIKDRIVNFKDLKTDNFILLRHDVEFSLERALEIALIEKKKNISSNFFIQVLSGAYNPFSVRNLKIINQIISCGHEIGLHFYVTHLEKDNHSQMIKELKKQKKIFETGLELECNIFSFHRPPSWILKNRDDYVDGMINVYGDSFFEFSDDPKNIKYIADSMHKWNYGHPVDYLSCKKIQILLHPDEWSINGSNDYEFFNQIINESRQAFIETLDLETKHFGLYKDKFK